MRKTLIIAIAMTLLFGLTAFAMGDGPGHVVATKHNLSAQSTATTKTSNAAVQEVCVFCHTPHNAAAAPVYTGAQIIPLWNHQTTTATFTVYASSTMEQVMPQPGSGTRACLSCHDGTVGVGSLLNVYGMGATTLAMSGNVTGTAPYTLTGASLVGTDLSNDHPVGIVYATSQAADPGLNPAATALPPGQPVTGTVANLLINANVECGSCHAVHGLPASFVPTAPDSAASFQPLLKISKYDSKLCTSCHIK